MEDCEGLELYCCVICGFFMGPNNPRQYCRKTWCPKLLEKYPDPSPELEPKPNPDIELIPKFKDAAVQTSD